MFITPSRQYAVTDQLTSASSDPPSNCSNAGQCRKYKCIYFIWHAWWNNKKTNIPRWLHMTKSEWFHLNNIKLLFIILPRIYRVLQKRTAFVQLLSFGVRRFDYYFTHFKYTLYIPAQAAQLFSFYCIYIYIVYIV